MVCPSPGNAVWSTIAVEFLDNPRRQTFYRPHDFAGLRVADLFMGGGTPLLEANRLRFDVIGHDINPMSFWIVKREIEHLDLNKYRAGADLLLRELEGQVGRYHRTRCLQCGSEETHVKYFLWVEVRNCTECGKEIRLFPVDLISESKRHPANVIGVGL
jgi:putative DNA methylase